MTKTVNFVKNDRTVEEVKENDFRVNAIYFATQHDEENPPYEISLKVGGKSVTFELDTGAGVTLISEKSLEPLPPMSSTNTLIRDYSGKRLNLRGKFIAKVEYEGKLYDLMVYVVKGNHQNLLGRNWINQLTRIDCPGKHASGRLIIYNIIGTIIWQAREELTSLTYSRPPFLPPRPATVSQSLEHLPSQQTALGQRSRISGSLMPYPITSTLSLHSGYAAPLQQTGPHVVPSLASNYYIQQRLIQQGQQPTVYPWPGEGPSIGGSFAGHNGRLFNGFSYPGHLNLTGGGDEPSRQGGDLGGGQMKANPSAATQSRHHAFGEYSGVQQSGDGMGGYGGGVLQSESAPMIAPTSFRRPSFPHVQQPPFWAGVFSMNTYANPYANYPYTPSNSATPLYCCPPYGYRGYNPMPYYDTNTASAPGFSQSVPCAPVSMPILNAGDEFYMTGGGETEELPGPNGYYQPSWYPYYDPYWQWIRAATGSSAGLEPRSFDGWPPSVVPPTPPHPHLPPPPPPPSTQIPMPPSTNAPLSALLSPYAGPTRRRIQQQKLAAARQLQRQQQQLQQHHRHGQGHGGAGRQVLRGISLQDLPSRTRSDSEGVGHTLEYSASRPSLVQMTGATSSITFQPSDTQGHGHTGSGGEGGEDQQPPGIFTSPPPPNLISNQSATSAEQLQLAYQQQIRMHRRIWEEWMWRASAAAAYPPPPPPPPPLLPQRGITTVVASGVPQQQRQRQQDHHPQQQQQQGVRATSSAFPSPGLGESGGGGTAASLKRMPPPPPPSYAQYMASGTSPQSAVQQPQQHLTPDIRDPSGPDGSSSVGYMGLDFHGVAPFSASPGVLTEGPQVPCSTEEPFQRHHEHLGSYSGLHRGQHPGSVDRLNTMSRIGRTSVPGYITNSHLYANMTIVDGKLVPLMGRPAPALPEPSPRSVIKVPPGSDDTRLTGQRATTALTRQSRPLTRYHSSQTVWLSGTICEPSETSRQQAAPPESVSPPQYAPTKVEIPKSVGFWEQ
ncbi:unnamed protein product [Rodentolepis nana]|uniref:RVP domain-containing protein n=1 Tax=Rodentolepis nana TaxID=102285 RepID=A0A158QGK3_RODNA|nr:unnamed protein product [Rodentolepis nana]